MPLYTVTTQTRVYGGSDHQPDLERFMAAKTIEVKARRLVPLISRPGTIANPILETAA
jgi:hypothetical protein